MIHTGIAGLIAAILTIQSASADDLGDFIAQLAPKDPTPVALKPIAKLQEAAMAAISFVGKPYSFGGSNPDTGFDCSGLVQYVLDQSGIKKLPRTSREMYQYSRPVDNDSLVVGDLLFFQTNNSEQVNHVGIYVGEGRFIHSPSTGNVIRLDRLDQSYWQKAFVGARRVLDLGE
ncbi:C40 family peptidase [Agitococcus lubricus]|uniref:Cell wall-associated NlpC family hydrolase n=1 Tax=Agitococcus lubricus TaxID=1077255 RepID=A0A2T5IUG0_9GAMM|nr:C40 family peptidase [Agitococcus lubricus]PTQ87529.1 cell wall-associated NlpC family hydrolase [Agitococcus lubricus]